MIKKNTKVIFEGKNEASEDLVGGIPLSKGEVIKVHKSDKITEYVVENKDIDCFMDGKDQEVNIVYTLKKKK